MTNQYVGWKDWNPAEFGRFTPEDALYFAKELHASGITSVHGLRVGELGYGNGGFAGWVRHGGGHWLGRDVIPEMQERATQTGFEVVAAGAEFSKSFGPASLDLIVAFDVIEHMDLEAIRSFLGEAKEALKPGGMLLVRTPNGDSPFSGAIYRGDLTHRTLLGASAARQLAMERGLTVCHIRCPALPMWGLGPVRALRRMVVRFMQNVVFSFVGYVLMGHGSAVLSPNMIVVLRKEMGCAE